jgi:hypothetical protein
VALEVHYATALPVYVEDPNGIVPTSASAVFRDSLGDTVETLAVVLPSVSTTISSVTNGTTYVVASATGLLVGNRYQVVSDGVLSVVTIVRIDGTNVHINAALPTQPDAGSTFKAIRVTASIAAPGESAIGPNYRLEWLYSDGTLEGFGSSVVNVVRWKWDAPVTAATVRQYIAGAFPSSSRTRDGWFHMEVARKACDRIRADVETNNRRPYLFGASDAFEAAGAEAMRWELAKSGMLPAGAPPGLFEQDRESAYALEFNKVMSSLEMYDRDDNGKIDSEEAAGSFWSISLSR